jgi:hypothetical protein
MPAVASTSGHLHCELVHVLFLQTHRETIRIFAASGVEHAHCALCLSKHRHLFISSPEVQELTASVSLSLFRSLSLDLSLSVKELTASARSHTLNASCDRHACEERGGVPQELRSVSLYQVIRNSKNVESRAQGADCKSENQSPCLQREGRSAAGASLEPTDITSRDMCGFRGGVTL